MFSERSSKKKKYQQCEINKLKIQVSLNKLLSFLLTNKLSKKKAFLIFGNKDE